MNLDHIRQFDADINKLFHGVIFFILMEHRLWRGYKKWTKNQNGLVFFHDIGTEETGTDPQAGGGFIEVRPAVEKLGLFNGSRKGWKFLKELSGSRKWGGDGNSLGIFIKQ